MIDVIQNARVDRAIPWWNSVDTGLREGLVAVVRVSAPARTRRKWSDSGRYFSITGTRIAPGIAPRMNIHRHPRLGITTIPSNALSTAPAWYPVIMIVVEVLPRPRRANSLIILFLVGGGAPGAGPASKRSKPKE